MTQPDPIRRAMTEIAEEVISNTFGKHPRMIDPMGVRCIAEEVFDKKIKTFTPTRNTYNPALNKIHNTLKNHGQHWNQKENDFLFEEFKVAMDTIASNHERSAEAIRCQLKRLGFLHTYTSK